MIKGVWHRTDVDMPKDGMDILVYDDYLDKFFIAYHNKEGWHLTYDGFLFEKSPEYWMPIPKVED